jgi:hypothetical protein
LYTDGGIWSGYFGGWVLAYTRINEIATMRRMMPIRMFMAVFMIEKRNSHRASLAENAENAELNHHL